MMLAEFLNHVGEGGQQLRGEAISSVRALIDDPNVDVVPQSAAQFDSAVKLYSSRLDKEWSLTDCASFVIMEEMNIREALAGDHDFEQAGCTILLS